MQFCLSFMNLCLSRNLLFIYYKFYHQNDLNIAFIIHLWLILKYLHQNKKHCVRTYILVLKQNYATIFSSAIYHQSWFHEWVMPFTKLIFLAWPHSYTGILFGQFKSVYTTTLMCSLGRYPWNAQKVSP